MEVTRRLDGVAGGAGQVRPPAEPAAPRELALDVAGRTFGSHPAAPGTQVGRNPVCELAIPDEERQASRVAATVLDVRDDGVKLRVDNRHGGWLCDVTGATYTIRQGRSVLLLPGQHLYLDADARVGVHLN